MNLPGKGCCLSTTLAPNFSSEEIPHNGSLWQTTSPENLGGATKMTPLLVVVFAFTLLTLAHVHLCHMLTPLTDC